MYLPMFPGRMAEDFRPGLYLSFPGKNWQLTLRKSKISLGCGVFSDVDLSGFCDFSGMKEICVVFRYEQGRWQVSNPLGNDLVLLNDAILREDAQQVKAGDRLLLAGQEEVLLKNVFEEQLLDQNMTLFFESISLKNGHAGSEVVYDTHTRMLTYRKWSVVKGKKQINPPETLQVPLQIQNKAELYAFVGTFKPCWPVQMQPPCEDDQLICFDNVNEIRYDGARKLAVYRSRENGSWREVDTHYCSRPFSRDFIRAELCCEKPNWPQSKNILLEDFVVVENRRREYILYHSGSLLLFCFLISASTEPDLAETQQIPEIITTREEVVAYAKKLWPWMFEMSPIG